MDVWKIHVIFVQVLAKFGKTTKRKVCRVCIFWETPIQQLLPYTYYSLPCHPHSLVSCLPPPSLTFSFILHFPLYSPPHFTFNNSVDWLTDWLIDCCCSTVMYGSLSVTCTREEKRDSFAYRDFTLIHADLPGKLIVNRKFVLTHERISRIVIENLYDEMYSYYKYTQYTDWIDMKKMLHQQINDYGTSRTLFWRVFFFLLHHTHILPPPTVLSA